MKKILFILVFIACYSFNAQIVTDSISEYRSYKYEEYDTPYLIKTKTELYLSEIQNKGVEIEKENVDKDGFKLVFYIPAETKDDYIVCRVRYFFRDNLYIVHVGNVNRYNLKSKKTTLINVVDDIYSMSYVRSVIFIDWQNEINSNF